MMSFAVASDVQYRLSEQDGGTLVKFQHIAHGLIPDDHSKGMTGEWGQINARTKKRAETSGAGRAAGG